MKSKAPLALMEMLIMVTVFALAAAICVNVFVKSSVYAAEGAARDRAVIEAENAAEVVRYCGGDMEKAAEILNGEAVTDELIVYYDTSWNTTKAEASFILKIIEEDSRVPGLGKAVISVYDWNCSELFQIPVGWQKKVDG